MRLGAEYGKRGSHKTDKRICIKNGRHYCLHIHPMWFNDYFIIS